MTQNQKENPNIFKNGRFETLYKGRRVEVIMRHDTLANWTKYNPVLLNAEPGFITDTQEIVVGDGVTPFIKLGRFKEKEQIKSTILTFISYVRTHGVYDLAMDSCKTFSYLILGGK